MKRRVATAIALGIVVLTPALCFADGKPSAEELGTARQLFDEAVKAEDRADWASALATYQRIAQITVSPVLLYRIAVCQDKLGHAVEAINAFELASQEAEKKQQDDVASEARGRAKELRETTPHLTLRVPADATGLSIEIDGKSINAALVGSRMLVDQGARHVIVRAESHAESFDATVDLGPRDDKTVEVTLGALRPEPPPAPPVVAPPPAAAPSPSAPDAASEAPSYLPIYIVGIATVGLAAGAVATGLVAHGKHTDYEAANADPAAGSLGDRTALREDGKTMALVSTVLTGAAVVGAGVTAYLLLSTPSAPAPKPITTGFSPWIGAGAGGVVAWGTL